MNLYLAIVSKQRVPIKTIDARIEQRVRKFVKATMFDYTEPVESVEWSDSGCSALFLFSLRGDRLKQKNDGHVFEDFAIANTGYPLESLKSLLERNGCSKQTVSTIPGVFSLCVLDKHTDEVRAYNNHMRLEEIYYAQDDDFFYIGTRALLLSALITPGAPLSANLNESLLTGFLHKGYFPCRGSAFKGVSETPMFTELSVTPAGLEISPIEDMTDCYFTRPLSDELIDEMTQDLIDVCRRMAPVCKNSLVGLTGGKDSRLMALAMHAAGMDFAAETIGDPTSPDVIVARRMADLLGVEHTCIPDEPWMGDRVTHDILGRTQCVLFTSDCGLYGFERCGAAWQPFDSNKVVFNGLGGEILRGGWARRLSRFTPEEVTSKVERLYDTMPDFFQGEAQAPYAKSYLSLFGDMPTTQPECMDLIYVDEHMGKWAAPMMRSWNTACYYFMPLCDEQFIKKTMTIKTLDKIDDRLIFEMMRRFDDRFTTVPLADMRWSFESTGPRAGDEKAYRLREPVVAQTPQGAFLWRTQSITDMKEHMREVIFDKKCEALFNHLKREKVEKLFSDDNDEYLAKAFTYPFAWNIYTAAVMLEGSWTEHHLGAGGGFEGNGLAHKPVVVKAPGAETRSRDDRIQIAKLTAERDALTRKNDALKTQTEKYKKSLSKKDARIKELKEQRQQDKEKIRSLRKRLIAAREKAKFKTASIERRKHSAAWKMRRMVTAVPRKIKKSRKQ